MKDKRCDVEWKEDGKYWICQRDAPPRAFYRRLVSLRCCKECYDALCRKIQERAGANRAFAPKAIKMATRKW